VKYVSLDLETTGLNPQRHQILEVGMVVDDFSWPEVVGEGPYGGRPYFSTLVYNGTTIIGESIAMKMNASLMEEITDTHPMPFVATRLIEEFLTRHFGKASEIVVAGKNVSSFDIPFLCNAFQNFVNPFHRRVMEPTMLYMEAADDKPPSLSKCLERAGIVGDVAHRACDDSWQVIQLLRHKLCK